MHDASRPKKWVALGAKDFCTSQPPQPAVPLSRHPPDLSPFTAHFPHICAPIHAMTRQRTKVAITASGSPKRGRRGRGEDGEKQVAQPPYLLRCPRPALPRSHLIVRQRVRFASMRCARVARAMHWRRQSPCCQAATLVRSWLRRREFRREARDRHPAIVRSGPARHYRLRACLKCRNCRTSREGRKRQQ